MPAKPVSHTSAAATPSTPAPDSPQAHIGGLRTQWETERRELLAEIQAYPTPVTACDVQFNTLLLRRGRLGHALQSLDAVTKAEAAGTLRGPALQARLRAISAELEAEAAVGHASVFVG